MITIPEVRLLLAQVGMVEGLAYEEVHRQIGLSLRVTECMQRRLAFFLVEMQDRSLYLDPHCSCPTIFVYARKKHGLSERRCREMLRVGRRLLDLPAVDQALCEQEIGWSKMLHLLRVATPECEEDWVEVAKKLPCQKLGEKVRDHKPGEAPREVGQGEGKGTPVTQHPVQMTLPPVTWKMQRLAQEKLSAEKGERVTEADLQEVLLDIFLQLERTGEIDGWKRVPSSVYKVHLYPLPPDPDDPADPNDPADPAGRPLYVETEEGLLPVDGSRLDDVIERNRTACADCDSERVGDGHKIKDEPTPDGMRRRVLARDGHKCRCCGSRKVLHVHHIELRSEGGPTRVWNLLVLCVRCHSLIHDGLLWIQGKTQKKARFVDGHGRPLHEEGKPAAVARLVEMAAPKPRPLEERLRLGRLEPEAMPLEALPEEVDGAWWQQHADRIRCRADQSLEYRADRPLREAEDAGPTEQAPSEQGEAEDAFEEIVGQEALLERLEVEARAAKALGTPFPHTLLTGPAGMGKTKIAEAIAARIGARLTRKNGPMLKDVLTLVRLLASLQEGDVLFLDEIHAVGRGVLEVLYEAMDERRLSLTFKQGALESQVVLKLPAFTLLAATTNPADLPMPLKSRAQLQEHVAGYTEQDLARQAAAAANRRGFGLDEEAALLIGRRARGTPREVLRLLERAIALGASRGVRELDLALAEEMLRQQGFDGEGLRFLEQRYLEVLQKTQGWSSIGRLADRLGMDVGTLLHEVEPELVSRGLLRISERGRMAAPPLRVVREAEAREGTTRDFKPSAARRTFAAKGPRDDVREASSGRNA